MPETVEPSVVLAPPPANLRRWDWRSRVRWFAAEIVVVVAGVLIALALNAWWGHRQEARAAASLRSELRRDIEQTRAVIAANMEASRTLAGKTRAVLNGMAAEGSTPSDSLLATIGSIFVLSSWEPIRDTYTEALGSGRLNLITDPDLRFALSRYNSKIDEVGQVVEVTERQYYGELEPFMVTHTIYSEIAYDKRRADLVQAPFRTDFNMLAHSHELWNLLTLRLELEVARQERLGDLDSLALVALNYLD